MRHLSLNPRRRAAKQRLPKLTDDSSGVDDVHFDRRRNRLYASCSDSALAVIEKKGDKYEVVEKLEAPKDSRTCAWSSGKLYLGVPRQDGQEGPEVRIYEARPVIERKPGE